MGRKFGKQPSQLLKLADETVAMAVDVAATILLIETDRERAEREQVKTLESTLAVTTGMVRPQDIQWETVEEW